LYYIRLAIGYQQIFVYPLSVIRTSAEFHIGASVHISFPSC